MVFTIKKKDEEEEIFLKAVMSECDRNHAVQGLQQVREVNKDQGQNNVCQKLMQRLIENPGCRFGTKSGTKLCVFRMISEV